MICTAPEQAITVHLYDKKYFFRMCSNARESKMEQSPMKCRCVVIHSYRLE